MVPGSTFRYGSNFIRLTRSPRLSNRQPSDAAASPLPRLDTTPPVTKMYLADMGAIPWKVCGCGSYEVGTYHFRRSEDGCKQFFNQIYKALKKKSSPLGRP